MLEDYVGTALKIAGEWIAISCSRRAGTAAQPASDDDCDCRVVRKPSLELVENIPKSSFTCTLFFTKRAHTPHTTHHHHHPTHAWVT